MPLLSKFSVLMSVYNKEKPENLKNALVSVIEQSCLPSEIVLVIDGPISDALEIEISAFYSLHPNMLKCIRLDRNLGLGNALKIGLLNCEFEIVARMDTDDLCSFDRFQRQLEILDNQPMVDVVGSNIEEFNVLPRDLNRLKVSPEFHEDLIRQIKLKSPFNHPSIMFRKKTILDAGNYNGDLPLFEDYALFLRLWLAGAKFYNIQKVLLHFRVGLGIETIKRRSGKHYLMKEWQFVKYAKHIGAFNNLDMIRYMLLKFPIRLLPAKIVLFIYNTFLRTSV